MITIRVIGDRGEGVTTVAMLIAHTLVDKGQDVSVDASATDSRLEMELHLRDKSVNDLVMNESRKVRVVDEG